MEISSAQIGLTLHNVHLTTNHHETPILAHKSHLSHLPPSHANPSATVHSVFPSAVAFKFNIA